MLNNKSYITILLCITFANNCTESQHNDRNFAVNWDLPPAEWVLNEAEIFSPEESIKRFDLPPGYSIEVVADDELLDDPISLTFGHDGRIWVVEYNSYNQQVSEDFGFEETGGSSDRIVVLEDTNGDGKMDKRTVFKDNLRGPRTVSIVDDGVLVAMPPEVWFYRDTTGDGKADYEELLIDDYGHRPNPHVMPGGLVWMMDNWIYSTIYTERLKWNNGEWIKDGPLYSRGQWGISQDDWGRLYYNWHESPLRADLIPVDYWKRNPNYKEYEAINKALYQSVEVWAHGPTPGVQPGHNNMNEEKGSLNRFTSASAPVIYRGENFPKQFYGDAFVAEPAGNTVRQFQLSEIDGVVDAVNRYDDHEFFFSHDERSRPVDLKVGPDGALYIVDMYRGIIEGYPWIRETMHDYFIRRNLHTPYTGMGRIYRIVHEDGPIGEWPSMHNDSAEELVQHLEKPNGWWRDNAQRLLIERHATEVEHDLRRLIKDTSLEPYVRLHGLWTLDGLNILNFDDIINALDDPNFRVRMHGLRLAEPWLDKQHMHSAIMELINDEHIEVRRQLLLTLGEVRVMNSEQIEVAMRQILERDVDAPFMAEAALSSLYGRELDFLLTILKEWTFTSTGRENLVRIFSEAITNKGDIDEMLVLVEMINDKSWWSKPVLSGIENGNIQNLAKSPDIIRYLLNLQDEELLQKATALVGDIEQENANTERGGIVDIDNLEQDVLTIYEQGRMAYLTCAACHQTDGQGIQDVAPPLIGSNWLNDSESMIRIVLHGFNARKDYPNMSALGGLDNEQLSAILTYVKYTWSENPNVIYPEDIQKIRNEVGSRSSHWTYEELEASMKD